MIDIDKLAQKIAERLHRELWTRSPSAVAEIIAAELREAEGELVATWMENELADYRMVLDHCTRTYYHFSGGRISKPNTYPEEVFAIAADLQSRDIEEAVAEATQEQGWRLVTDTEPPIDTPVLTQGSKHMKGASVLSRNAHGEWLLESSSVGYNNVFPPRWFQPLPSPPEE